MKKLLYYCLLKYGVEISLDFKYKIKRHFLTPYFEITTYRGYKYYVTLKQLIVNLF